MLAILKKPFSSLKALSAGSLAFAIGLTGAAAYVGGTLAHENLTFSKEQPSISKPADEPKSDPAAMAAVESSGGNSGLTASQNVATPSPTTPTAPVASTAPTPTPPVVNAAGTATGTVQTGGMGGGAAPEANSGTGTTSSATDNGGSTSGDTGSDSGLQVCVELPLATIGVNCN